MSLQSADSSEGGRESAVGVEGSIEYPSAAEEVISFAGEEGWAYRAVFKSHLLHPCWKEGLCSKEQYKLQKPSSLYLMAWPADG